VKFARLRVVVHADHGNAGLLHPRHHVGLRLVAPGVDDQQVGPQADDALGRHGLVLGRADIRQLGEARHGRQVMAPHRRPVDRPLPPVDADHAVPAAGPRDGGEFLEVEGKNDALGCARQRHGAPGGVAQRDLRSGGQGRQRQRCGECGQAAAGQGHAMHLLTNGTGAP
jgi:hypothetical protein